MPEPLDLVLLAGPDDAGVDIELDRVPLAPSTPYTPPALADDAAEFAYLAAVRSDGALVGLLPNRLDWVVDPVPYAGALGPAQGWNLEASADSTDVHADPPWLTEERSFELALSLAPVETVALGGTMPSEDALGRRIALVSALDLEGTPVAAPVVAEVEAAAAWSLTATGPVDADHLTALDLGAVESITAMVPGFLVGPERPVLYEDADESGTFSAGEPVVGEGCVAGARFEALWVPPASTVSDALVTIQARATPGWLLAVGADVATVEQATQIGFVSGC